MTDRWAEYGQTNKGSTPHPDISTHVCDLGEPIYPLGCNHW